MTDREEDRTVTLSLREYRAAMKVMDGMLIYPGFTYADGLLEALFTGRTLPEAIGDIVCHERSNRRSDDSVKEQERMEQDTHREAAELLKKMLEALR